MATIAAPPSTSSILNYPPNFPAGIVNPAWLAWFQTVQTNSLVYPTPQTGFALGWDAGGNLINVANTGADQTAAWTAADAVVTANFQTADAGLLSGYQAGDAAIRSDLLSTTVGKGAALISYLAPYTGSVGTTQQEFNSRSVNVFDFLSGAQKTDVSSRAATLDVSAAVQAAITALGATGGTIVFPAGIYKISTPISCVASGGTGLALKFQGAGMGATTLRAGGAMSSIINAFATVDANPSPLIINDMTLDGASGAAVTGINVQYFHYHRLNNVEIAWCQTNYQAINSWCNTFTNCVFRAAYANNITLLGTNHRNAFYSCTVDNAATLQLLIQSGGVDSDNKAILFSNCDFEYSVAGSCIDILAREVTFECCYIGEGIPLNVLTVRGTSLVRVRGGWVYYGMNTTSNLVNSLGGKVVFDECTFFPAANATFSRLIVGGAGKVKFRDCMGTIVSNTNCVWSGDVLDYGPQGPSAAMKLGQNYTTGSSGTAPTGTWTGNQRGLTAVSGTTMMELYSALTNSNQWFNGGVFGFIIVYKSNCPVAVYLSNTAGGFTTLMYTLPSTAGVLSTFIAYDTTSGYDTHSFIEFVRNTPSVGDTFTLQEVFLLDARMINPEGTYFGNIYKP